MDGGDCARILVMISLGQLASSSRPMRLELVDLDPTARPSAGEVLYRLQVIVRMYEAYTI
ncbi:hypothetical protein GQ600_5871 [Phytophthora cactorum]|nr:hypothetical protein GQ600_5871 [Phytophthora cactorum]